MREATRMVAAFLITTLAGNALAEAPKHIKVYYEPGRFGGWPANHGVWSWGNEILVGFTSGFYKDLGPDRHHIDREKPELHFLGRSMDGGETWTVVDPGTKGFLVPQGGFLHGVEREDVPAPELRDLTEPMDFTHPDFVLTVRTDDIHAGTSRFFYSYDRGHTWEGPFRLPNFGTPGTAARTDYIIDGPKECMLFLTAAKENGQEGRTFCARTTDGGLTWEFVGWIGPEPEGFSIMPAAVRLSDEELYVTVRRREGPKRWIGAYRSLDNGRTWTKDADPIDSAGEGNPPSLIKLEDGRLCLTYGYRAAPFSIRARLSEDNGKTWSEDIMLRDDGAGRDIGYVRSVQRPDGRVVALYYFHDDATGPERYVAATIWNPDDLPGEG